MINFNFSKKVTVKDEKEAKDIEISSREHIIKSLAYFESTDKIKVSKANYLLHKIYDSKDGLIFDEEYYELLKEICGKDID